jgi:hypothetical protein
MNRIAPEEVVAAYRKTGLIPERTAEHWFSEDGKCGCGATAVMKARNPEFCNSILSFKDAIGLLEVSGEYLRGFIHGFDGREPRVKNLPEYDQGYRDGIDSCRAAFREAGLPVPPPCQVKP